MLDAWLLVYMKALGLGYAGGLVAGLFIAVIFIRITVPRFRLETLSRLG